MAANRECKSGMAIVKDYEDDSVEIDTEKCEWCKGETSVQKSDGSKMTSKELCAQMKMCSATIDWELMYSQKYNGQF